MSWYNAKYSVPSEKRMQNNGNELEFDREVLCLGPRGGYFIGVPTWQTSVNNPYYREKFSGKLHSAAYWRELPSPPPQKEGKPIKKSVTVRKLEMLRNGEGFCICEHCVKCGGRFCSENRGHPDEPISCTDFMRREE